MRNFHAKTILHYRYVRPNLIANAVYSVMLFTAFEGLHRYNERKYMPIPPGNHVPSYKE